MQKGTIYVLQEKCMHQTQGHSSSETLLAIESHTDPHTEIVGVEDFNITF